LLGIDAERTALAAALALGSRFRCHVDAVLFQPDPRESLMLLGDGLSTSVVEQILRSAEGAATNRREVARCLFDQAAVAAGILTQERPDPQAGASATFQEITGDVTAQVVDESRLHDLVVIAHGAVSQDPTAWDSLESALLFSAKPVLLVPLAAAATEPALTTVPSGRHIAIAWDGGAHAARAVAGALPLLTEADSVTIVSVGSAASPGLAAERLAGYLAWHGITAAVARIQASHQAIGPVLLREVTSRGIDLLVMGAYGHSRMREMILGGVTRHILANGALPVLLTH